MRRLFVASVAAAAALFAGPARAESLLKCSDPSTVYRTVCGDQELRALGNEIDGEMERLLRGADPLSALLLKRDQIFFEDILSAGNLLGFQGQDDEVYARLMTELKARRRALAHLRTSGVTTPEGSWSNVFASATVAKAEGNALTITLEARLSYPEERRGEIDCAAKVTATLDKDGWYSATISDKKDVEDRIDVVRFRLQGNTLRVVHEANSEAGVCNGKEKGSADDGRRGGADVLTGSFFPSGPADTSGGAARAVTPSFDCAKAENADEEEICADPELAQADREIARLYGETLRRLDRKLAGYLRADQRAWASDNPADYLAALQPGSDKSQTLVHHTSDARRRLFLRQQERILLLSNLDEKRKGLEGYWLGYNASLLLAPDKDKSDGTLHARGGKTDVENWKAYCSFDGDGKIVNGVFKTHGEYPTLTRDGDTLVVDAEGAGKGGKDDDVEQPDYCSKLRSPKARLFPVKGGSGIDEIRRQLR